MGGCSEDEEEAVKWYKMSAEQSNTKAYRILGQCYENGYGVEKDIKEAVQWYEKAAEKGDRTV